MACAAETIETGRESWMATYFQKVFKTVTDKETGEIQQVMYCDCKLLQPDNSPCKSSYVLNMGRVTLFDIYERSTGLKLLKRNWFQARYFYFFDFYVIIFITRT